MVSPSFVDKNLLVSAGTVPPKQKKHIQLIERTYQSNTESDYTEEIARLGRSFTYEANSQHFWGDPEFSSFYGTPLYAEASASQKLALNHLYWIGQYQHTAAAESNTMLYNQVTTGVFTHLSGYETLCKELDLETSQERFHINTFQKIAYKTKLAIMGKEAMGNPLPKPPETTSPIMKQLSSNLPSGLQDASMRFLTRLMFAGKSSYFSQFLREKGESSIPTATGGLAGLVAPASVFKFLTLNWGSSPFMAAQYYSARMIANMSLKAYEHSYFRRYRDLDKTDAFVPIPTAVSYYHLLDEAFHTTMSQTISQEVYKDFAKPSAYEQTLANTIVWLTQRGVLGGLSGMLPATFRDDACFLPTYYRFLTSPLFGMNKVEALDWMEKCLCHEHEGFHANFQHHQTLLHDFKRFFDRLEYLWPVNRQMQVMAKGGSIEQAIAKNCVALADFRRALG